MAAFGLSDQGSNARGHLEQIPYWFYDQLVNQLQRGPGNIDLGQGYLQNYTDYLQNIMNDPYGGYNPEDVNYFGRIIMPGVDQAIADRQARLDALPKVQSGTDVTNLLTGINNARNSEYLNTLADTFDPLSQGVNDTYGYLRGLGGNTYGDLQKSTGDAYAQAQQNLQRLMPGGDLAAAAAARSFAPAMAAAQRRLRTAGIDPNSPEASGILQGVDVARGHSMDDILANNYANYVNQGNQLTLGKNNAISNLKLGNLSNESNLAQQQDALIRQLGLQRGNLALENTNNNAAQQSGIVNQGRQMSVQDYQLAQQLADLYNNANLQGIDLNSQRYQAGTGQLARSQAERNAAAGQYGNIGQSYINLGLNDLNQARGFGNDAASQFGNILRIESANSGWGTKLLGGVLGGAASLIPGVGPILGPAIGGAFGGGGYPGYSGMGGYGGGSGYGFGTPPFLPQQGNTSNPSAAWGNMFGQIRNLFHRPKTNYGFDYPNPAYAGAPGGTA